MCSEGTPHRKGGVEVPDTRPMRRSFRTRGFFVGSIPRVGTLGWYAMPPSGHGIGHVVGGSGKGNTVGVRYREQPGHGRAPKTWLPGPVTGTRWGSGIETVIVHYALNGPRIPAQGIALGTASTESVCSEGTPHRKGGVEAQDTRPMRRSFRTRVSFSGWIPRVGTLGWYAMPRQGMGFETPVDIEVE